MFYISVALRYFGNKQWVSGRKKKRIEKLNANSGLPQLDYPLVFELVSVSLKKQSFFFFKNKLEVLSGLAACTKLGLLMILFVYDKDKVKFI